LISIEKNDKPDPKWNDRLVESGLGTIYQASRMSSSYIDYKKPIFLTFVNEKGSIVGQLQLNEIPRFEKKGKKGDILKKIPRLKKKICKWAYGPIIFDTNFKSDIYIALGKFLTSRNFAVSGTQHPLSTEGISVLEKDFELKRWSTFLIDLTKSQNDLYRNIDKNSGRKNIERAIKRGVIIEEINEKNLHEFTELYYWYKEKRMAKNEEFDNMRKWWKIQQPLGYSGFLSKRNDFPLGGIMFSHFNKYIIEGGVSRSEKDTKMKLYSQDLMKWKIIEWGINNKMRYYDLAGFNPNPESKKEDGIFRYKKKWGGKRYDYYKIIR